MTEKDAIKCKKFANKNWWMLRVDAIIADNFAEIVLNKIKNFMDKKLLELLVCPLSKEKLYYDKKQELVSKSSKLAHLSEWHSHNDSRGGS